MDLKNVNDLKFELSLFLGFNDNDEEEYKDIIFDKDVNISKKDKSLVLSNLREFKDECDIKSQRIDIYKGDTYIGKAQYYVINKVTGIGSFISAMEWVQGDAGVCACEVVESQKELNYFKTKVKGKRFVYLHYISFEDEYYDEAYALENEEFILEVLIKLFKKVYNTKNIYARPIAMGLSEDETVYLRCEYYNIEMEQYKKYRRHMVGYVFTYYSNIHESIKHLSSFSEEKIQSIRDSYRKKQYISQKPYFNCGMKLLSTPNAGVLVFDEELEFLNKKDTQVELIDISNINDKYKEFSLNGNEELDKIESSLNDISSLFNNSKNLSREELLEDKYLIKGAEDLSYEIAKILRSNRGCFIVNYAVDFGINRYTDGFDTLDELISFAKWVVNQTNTMLEHGEKKLEELYSKEKSLTLKERIDKELRRKDAELNIYLNIFDFEGKKKFCDEAQDLKNVHSELNALNSLYNDIKPIENELHKLIS